MRTEPALLIGFITTVILLVAQQFLDSGIVTSAEGVKWVGVVIAIVPLLSAAVIRYFVSPAVNPGL